MHKGAELYFITVIGIILGLVLVGFIITTLFIYQRRQRTQERELERLRNIYEKELLRSQLEMQENTFKIIAQELHDNIGQMLSVVKLSLSALPLEQEHPAYEPVKSSQQILYKAIFDLSNLTKGLHTDRIVQIGLPESIRFELAALKKAGVLKVQLHQTGTEVPLNEQKGIFLFRIFQESLNNILKHAQATEVIVDINYEKDLFTMDIKDNGVGFDVNDKQDRVSAESGVGLKNLYNRASLIGAALTIDSEPTKGTITRIKLPLQEE